MKLKVEELTGQYKLLDVLDHQELVPFIRTYLKKRTFFSISYTILNILAFGLVFYYFVYLIIKTDQTIGNLFTYFSYGLALTFLLLPVHELIHALAYKIKGAEHISFKANLKKFYFMALADRFVANRNEFTFVALAPFVTITLTFITLIFFVSPLWKLSISAILLAHTAMCSGDFGLLSYFAFHRNKELVTYDEHSIGKSYFLERNSTSY